MYTRHEASLLNQEFWTTLGQYMSPIHSAEGEKINWVNYKTGVRNIRFVMTAGHKTATVAIQLSHSDLAQQEICFQKFVLLETVFEQHAGKGWRWDPMIQDQHGKTISLISITKSGAAILDKAAWPDLISFFKSHLLTLDKFWCENRFVFEA